MKNILSLIVFLCIYSCDFSTAKDNIIKGNSAKSITFIFEHHQKVDDILKISNAISYKTLEPEISYYEYFHDQEIPVGLNTIADTCTIFPQQEYLILRDRFNAIEYSEFLFKMGDTVLIKYVNGRPTPFLLNRKVLAYDLNYDESFRKMHDKQFPNSVFKYLKSDLFLDYSKSVSEIKKEKIDFNKNAYQNAILQLKIENDYLDSLKENNALSFEMYAFYKNRTQNIVNLITLKELKLISSDSIAIIQRDTLKLSLFPNKYYHLYLEAVCDKLFAEKAKIIDLKDGVNRDYREIYSTIKNSSLLSTRSKNYLLTREIQRISKSFSKDDIQYYFKKFESDVNDTAMLNFVRSELFLTLENKISTTEAMSLISSNKNYISFNDFLKNNVNKVIYVDFWASWCVPCRLAMPDSKKLREKYKGKNIVFVYLSIDKSFEDWKKAAIKEEIFPLPGNFLVVNPSTSKYLKTLNVEDIPRYLLFDRKGRLSHKNAPSPSSNQLQIEIDKLLSKPD